MDRCYLIGRSACCGLWDLPRTWESIKDGEGGLSSQSLLSESPPDEKISGYVRLWGASLTFVNSLGSPMCDAFSATQEIAKSHVMT